MITSATTSGCETIAAWLDPEITVVVAGAPARTAGPADVAEAVAEVSRRVAGGLSRRYAVAAVAAEAGLSRRLVYEAVVSPGVSS